MNKKILIGSIGAVVIIILAGFTSVVGVNSATTYDEKISPLFNLRAEKALNDENKETIKTDYIGVEKNNLIKTYVNFYKSLGSDKLRLGQTPQKYDTEGHTYCHNTCYGYLPTCNFLCDIFDFIFLLFLIILATIFKPGCTRDDNCSDENSQLSVLSQKMDGNSLLKQLIADNPELLPEIIALNS